MRSTKRRDHRGLGLWAKNPRSILSRMLRRSSLGPVSLGPIPSLVALAFCAVLGGACEKTIYKSHESHFCSHDQNDDPFYECSRSQDLVCINTYRMSYPSADGKPPVVRDMWLCRIACVPGDMERGCPTGEVCCPGPITGRNYGAAHACVTPNYCPGLAVGGGDGGRPMDARVLPEGPVVEAGAETATDATSDGGADNAASDAGAPETGADAAPDVIDAPMELGQDA